MAEPGPQQQWRNPPSIESAGTPGMDVENLEMNAAVASPGKDGPVMGQGDAVMTEVESNDRIDASRRQGVPYLEIEEQPKERGFRFRYQCEGPSHGGIPGASSDPSTRRRTHPTVRLRNPEGIPGDKCRVVVSLICSDDPLRPHAHSLVGRSVYSGQCVVELGKNSDWRASFPNLGILHVTKKNVARVLVERYALALVGNEELGEFLEAEPQANEELAGGKAALEKLSRSDVVKITELAEEQARTMKLNQVRLCFQAFLQDGQGGYNRPLPPCISNVIHDSKAPSANALKICRLDRHSGRVEGGEEVYLLCDRVQKDDISVKFFEANKDGAFVWEADATFSPSDVHRQFAIVFKTPPYRSQNITDPVSCWLRLQRKSDDEFSEPKPFTYQPKIVDEERIGRKRKKQLPPFQNYYGGLYGGPPPQPPPGGSGGGGSSGGGSGLPSGFGDGLGLGDSSGLGGLGWGMDLDMGGSNFLGGSGYNLSASAGRGNQADSALSAQAVKAESAADSQTSALQEVEQALSAQLEHHLRTEEAGQMQGQQQQQAPMPQQQQLLGHQQQQLKQLMQQQQQKQSQQDAQSQQRPPQPDAAPQPMDTSSANQPADKQAYLARRQQVYEAQLAHLSNAFQSFAKSGDVRFLLATQRGFAGETNENGDTALHLAIIRQQPRVLAQLLDVLDGLPKHLINCANQLRQTPLHLAIITKQQQLVMRLVRAGANVMQADRHGNNSAHLACKDGTGPLLKALLGHGTGEWLEARNFEGMTPAHLAVLSDSSTCLQLLHDAGANMNTPDGKSGRTPLHHAIEQQHLSVAGWLLTTVGVEVTSQTYDGATPLHWAAGRGMESMVKLLVAAGADPNVANASGDTPISLAPSQEIQALLKAPALDPASSMQRVQGDLGRLSYMARQQVAYLMDRDHSWANLSDLLGFGTLSTAFSLTQSPTQELLVHHELNDGTVASLKAALQSMQRQDAIDIIDRALAMPVPGLRHGSAGTGALASAVDSSLVHEVQNIAEQLASNSPVKAN